MKLELYNCDVMTAFKNIKDESIDLIITDPPYNIGKDFENDNLQTGEYLEWCEGWLKECNRVLIAGGALWITIGWQTVAELKVLINKFQELRLKNWVIWYRQDGWKGDKGFAQSYEHILFYIKDNIPTKEETAFRNYLNKKRIEKGLSLSDINKHFGWASNGGGCASGYMGDKKQTEWQVPGRGHYELLKAYLDLDNSFDNLPFGVKFNKTDLCDDVWLKPKSEKDRNGHPTQKPLKLIERMIIASSNEGDVILDLFSGSGTTAVGCINLNRNCIIIEKDPRFIKQIKERLNWGKSLKQIEFEIKQAN